LRWLNAHARHFGIKSEHTIVEFLGSRRLVLKPYEVLNVAARFLAVPRGVIRIERAVSDDNRTRIEGFDFIDSGKPIVEAFFTVGVPV
jgi:hypothetical protein